MNEQTRYRLAYWTVTWSPGQGRHIDIQRLGLIPCGFQTLYAAPPIICVQRDGMLTWEWPITTRDQSVAAVLTRDDALAWIRAAHAHGATCWGLEVVDDIAEAVIGTGVIQ